MSVSHAFTPLLGVSAGSHHCCSLATNTLLKEGTRNLVYALTKWPQLRSFK